MYNALYESRRAVAGALWAAQKKNCGKFPCLTCKGRGTLQKDGRIGRVACKVCSLTGYAMYDRYLRWWRITRRRGSGKRMRRFFIADTHFGHHSIKSGRGIIGMMGRTNGTGQLFNSIEEHDAYLIDTINFMIRREDQLIIVGDFGDPAGRYRQQIKCRNIILVIGNHDKHAKCCNVFGVGNVKQQFETKVFDAEKKYYMKVWLSHYPTAYWNGSHKGWGHLYGHTHMQREETLDKAFPGRRALDVGVDNIFDKWGDYRPLADHEVFEYLIQREGHDHVEFYNNFQKNLYKSRGLI